MRPIASLVASFAFAASVAPERANANGRFPAAQYVVVGPGASADRVVLRATFGLVISTDGGATFHWSCEQALEYSGQWDPSTAVSADGAVLAGLPDGMIATRDGCAYARVAGVGSDPIRDLANDPTGKHLLALESAPGSPSRVLTSSNSGASFTPAGTALDGLLLETIESAPTRASRVYVSASRLPGGAPLLLRSDDGASTFITARSDFLGGTDAFVSGVDPRDADRVWLRSNAGGGTMLLDSRDAGATLAIALRTAGPMLGFAQSDDGLRVWAGGPDDGLYRSDDGGASFAQVSPLAVTCLRYHAGALYVCGDWARDGVALWRWDDGASVPRSLLRFEDIAGPFECAAGTVEHDTCGARWPGQRTQFARPDAGTVLDAGDAASGVDAGRDAMDAAGTDDVGGRVTVSGGCAARPRRTAPLGVGAVLVAFALRRARRLR